METNGGADRIAVLIDAENTPSDRAEDVLNVLAAQGVLAVRRAYGDWSGTNLSGWTKKLNQLGLRAIHQTAFTRGKNSSDFALIIDAMDLLYAGHVDAFALVTSDSDFTSIANRLRESGRTVYAVGDSRKTPISLQNAVDKFMPLELVNEQQKSESEADPDSDAPAPFNLQSALTRAVAATADEDGWTTLPALGQQLRRVYPAFDPRAHGEPRLITLVDKQGYLVTTGSGNKTRVRVKGPQPAKKTTAKKTAAKKS